MGGGAWEKVTEVTMGNRGGGDGQNIYRGVDGLRAMEATEGETHRERDAKGLGQRAPFEK